MNPFRRAEPDLTAIFLGKRGVGKSTSLNRLFELSLATDPAVECTTKPHFQRFLSSAGKPWKIVDMPGIAASLTSANRYARCYRRWISRADVIVWITQADVRAYKQDQQFFLDYAPVVRPEARLVIAISKIDTLAARGDHTDINLLKDDEVVRRKVADVREQIAKHYWRAPEQAVIVPYSIIWNWNIDTLRNAIIDPAMEGAKI